MVSVSVLVAVAAPICCCCQLPSQKLNARRGRLEEVFDFDKPIEEDPITAAAVHLSGKGFGKPDDVIRGVGKPQREQRLLVDLLL